MATPRRGTDARASRPHGRGLLLALLPLALMLPFVGHAFHVDEPLFLWIARHIQAHPGDPYGFKVNWYYTDSAVSAITKNPPLAAYYLAGVAAVVGWNELPLHLAFVLPALATAIGAHRIASRYCANATLAVLAALLTPVFLVSSLTVMCDVMMLAFWVWAVDLWLRGLDADHHATLALAALLAAAAALTKYYGMTLVPLLLVYSAIRRRRAGWWLAHFAIPVAILAAYQAWTHHLYGRGLLLDAAQYASAHGALQNGAAPARDFVTKAVIDLAFTGGCVASVLWFGRQLWSRAALGAGLALAAVLAVAIGSGHLLPVYAGMASDGARWLVAAQAGLWATAGIGVLALAALDLNAHRDADALLLFLWTVGTFAFAGFVNWSVNGRSLLPLVIPVGILVARRLERRRARGGWPGVAVPLVASAALALAVAWADATFADDARLGAQRIHERYPAAGRSVWFEGHWGFQYYMQALGMRPMDVQQTTLTGGDLIAVPEPNINTYPLPSAWAAKSGAIELPSRPWLSTMSTATGAGFYADLYGPLPFAFGRAPAPRFTIYDVRPQAQP